MSLKDKLLKNSTIKMTSMLADSVIYNERDMIPTHVPMINAALGGSIRGGITPGTTMLAGPSKHFKTGFALLFASSFLKKYPDGVILFYDSEFGTPQGYFKSFGINTSSVVHTPITDIEELKHDISVQLKEMERNDKVMIIIDSIGNLASKKEVDDAIDGKTVADMTRAKGIKSFFRIATPKVELKNIPMIIINHTYQTMEMFSKAVVSGGSGSVYNPNTIWILGRQQEKEDDEIAGYNFIINVEKSRYVKEKSRIPITITYENGINKWSGLLDIALDGGYMTKPKKGYYALVNKETGEIGESMKLDEFKNSDQFWEKLLDSTDIADYIEKKYKLPENNRITEEEAG